MTEEELAKLLSAVYTAGTFNGYRRRLAEEAQALPPLGRRLAARVQADPKLAAALGVSTATTGNETPDAPRWSRVELSSVRAPAPAASVASTADQAEAWLRRRRTGRTGHWPLNYEPGGLR